MCHFSACMRDAWAERWDCHGSIRNWLRLWPHRRTIVTDRRRLEQLGSAHAAISMHEIVTHPEQVAALRKSVAAGQSVDWNDVFAGYQSQVDWPGSHVWRELSAAFPDAKVVHTLRPAEQLVEQLLQDRRQADEYLQQIPLPPHMTAILDVVRTGWLAIRYSAEGLSDRDHLHRRHSIATRSRSWHDTGGPAAGVRCRGKAGSRCAQFLGVAVPARAFTAPSNLRADFWEVLVRRTRRAPSK